MYCYLHKGLKITFNGAECRSQNGLLDLLDNMLNDALRDFPIPICHIYDEKFEIAFAYAPGSGEYIRSCVNNHHTCGGAHHEAFPQALLYALSKCLNKKITTKQCSSGLVAVIEFNIQWPMFTDAAKTTLSSRHMWYDAEDDHGPARYDIFKKALLKAISDNEEALTGFGSIWERINHLIIMETIYSTVSE